MKQRDKLAIFDLDGTLFDTKNVNYRAYSRALEICGIDKEIDYRFYCEFCNGSSYKVFLPMIIPEIETEMMERIHSCKKSVYKEYLFCARKNNHLFNLIATMKEDYQIAIATTASRENVNEILNTFGVYDEFDFLITQEDVTKTKPDSECFRKAISRAQVEIKDVIIFEDSDIGIQAAKETGADFVRVYGYN